MQPAGHAVPLLPLPVVPLPLMHLPPLPPWLLQHWKFNVTSGGKK